MPTKKQLEERLDHIRESNAPQTICSSDLGKEWSKAIVDLFMIPYEEGKAVTEERIVELIIALKPITEKATRTREEKAKAFRDLVQNSNKSQQEIATELGVHQTLVSLWVCGKCKPNIADLPKIAKVLGCSIEDIVSSVAR